MNEHCCKCGIDVSFGSGNFINRVQDFNKDPKGDFVCYACDSGSEIEDCDLVGLPHEPSQHTVHSVWGESWVFDVNCRKCGKSGSFRLQFGSVVELQWDQFKDKIPFLLYKVTKARVTFKKDFKMPRFLITRIRTKIQEAQFEIEADTYEDAKQLSEESEVNDKDYKVISANEENSVQTVS